MGWYRSRRIIIERPYLIDPYRSISIREAKRQWKITGYPDNGSLLDTARSIATSEDIKNKIVRVKKRNRNKIVENLRYVFTFRKAALVSYAIVLVLACFLTLSAPGRALAKSIYSAVTKIVENMLYIRPSIEDFSESNYPIEQSPIPQVSIEEFEIHSMSLNDIYCEITNVFLTLAPDYAISDLELKQSSISGLTFEAIYTSQEGIAIIIRQRWPVDLNELEVNVDISNKNYQSRDLELGMRIEGILSNDNIYAGFSIWNDAVIAVSIDGGQTELNWNTIDRILDDIYLYHP